MRANGAEGRAGRAGRGLMARLRAMFSGWAGPCTPAPRFEDIKSLSNAEFAVRNWERVELPLATFEEPGRRR